MHASLRPGLTARLDYMVPAERTVPHLLPESDDFAALPAVLATLTVHVELTAVEGRQLTFTVHAHDDAGTVCRGTHRRAVINTERFHARLGTRTAA